jgi:cardiolipin synthase
MRRGVNETALPRIARQHGRRHGSRMRDDPAPAPEDCPRASDDDRFEVDGNRLEILPDGQQRLEAVLALVAGAERTLRLLYYIYTDDVAGRKLRDALLDALRRGVSVSMVVDGFGSAAPPDFFKPLEEAGATVCRFLPRFGRRYLLRNHQKLALADEARVIIGGFNIEDSYFDDADGWRDLGLIVDGPAAKRIAGYYDALSEWSHTPKARLRDLRRTLSQWSDGQGRTRWLFGGPTRHLSPWAQVVRQDMHVARRLDMIAAYFAPNPALMRRMERATPHGPVRLITAGKSDNNATIAAARHCYARLLKRQVRVFEYGPRKLHTKLYVVDDAVHIGSANFDVRSLYLNLEIMLRIEDRAFADHMRAYVDREVADSHEITREEHEKAGAWQRVKWAAAYFIVAVLDGNITRRLNFGVSGR